MNRAEPFGEQTAWFAFSTTDVERVRARLFGTAPSRAVGWEEGVAASYDSAKVLVTPPIDGYVLATSRTWLSWWRDGSMATSASEWAADLDGEIQYYASDRGTQLYGWGRYSVERGAREFTRRDGELVQNEGAITDDERALAVAFRDDWEAAGSATAAHHARLLARTRTRLVQRAAASRIALVDDAGTLDRGPLAGVSPDDLTTLAALLAGVDPGRVAARWSVDPNTLDERTDLQGTCWLGDASES